MNHVLEFIRRIRRGTHPDCRDADLLSESGADASLDRSAAALHSAPAATGRHGKHPGLRPGSAGRQPCFADRSAAGSVADAAAGPLHDPAGGDRRPAAAAFSLLVSRCDPGAGSTSAESDETLPRPEQKRASTGRSSLPLPGRRDFRQRRTDALPFRRGSAAAAGNPGGDPAGPHRHAARAAVDGLPEKVPVSASADVPGPVSHQRRRTDFPGTLRLPAPPEDLRTRSGCGDRPPARRSADPHRLCIPGETPSPAQNLPRRRRNGGLQFRAAGTGASAFAPDQRAQ